MGSQGAVDTQNLKMLICSSVFTFLLLQLSLSVFSLYIAPSFLRFSVLFATVNYLLLPISIQKHFKGSAEQSNDFIVKSLL
jgi:hypothetical protein